MRSSKCLKTRGFLRFGCGATLSAFARRWKARIKGFVMSLAGTVGVRWRERGDSLTMPRKSTATCDVGGLCRDFLARARKLHEAEGGRLKE